MKKAQIEGCWRLGFTKPKLVGFETTKKAAYYVAKYVGKDTRTRVRASLNYGKGGSGGNEVPPGSLATETPLGDSNTERACVNDVTHMTTRAREARNDGAPRSPSAEEVTALLGKEFADELAKFVHGLARRSSGPPRLSGRDAVPTSKRAHWFHDAGYFAAFSREACE